ncbi:hypothetical protein CA54_14330 [Symmachiella macrocystis]|uniref:Lipoprotein n=1 Tax=Symmachiella macrocystis TaxID=2527985 RepID=A0A5C6BNH9_9PLAN|nr:hypothetical protein [Symmachiella macrocystis]TWU12609.1 hypothetical protein CA54_14330 [Symmachiella macrocystis]
MKFQWKAACALCAALMFVGCTRVVVKKDPGYDDKGFRYYRPKPYLFITPGTSGGGGGGGASTFSIQQGKPLEIKTGQTGNAEEIAQAGYQLSGTDGDVTDENTFQKLPAPGAPQAPQKISIDLVYMPDFAEEYSVELKPGLGIGELSMKLEDGWKLTSVGVKTDQQVDEIISSVAEVVEAGGGLIPKGTDETPVADGQVGPQGIYATNVPFGFYEAVIACDPCGRKQLYGWRYVGFMPFQSCPTQPCGMQTVGCETDVGTIFGLVWVNGILQFAEIGEIPREPQP